MKINFRAVLPALVLGALTASTSFASTIVLGVAGDALVGQNYVSFGQYPAGAPYAAAPNGYGTFEVTAPVGDVFAANGVAPGELGKIASLANAYEMPGVNITPPLNFMDFLGAGSNLQLYMTQLQLPTGNPPGDPFVLSDTAAGATASFSALGYILDTTTSTRTPYDGVFSATFAGTTVAALVTSLPIATPFSGTFTLTTAPTVPEPASLLLMGLGLLGAGFVARKKISA